MTKAPWKSKNLITRLRWWGFKFCGKGDHENIASDVMCDAADRIEKLEAALRKYAEEEYNGFNGSGEHARKALEGKYD